MARRLLVAGIGNIFFADDAFGVEVARRLMGRPLPDGVEVVDFGIRGFDLACALLDGYEAAILIDATPRGGKPGTLYVIEPELTALDSAEHAWRAGGIGVEAHALDPVQVLELVNMLGGRLPRLCIVGCEPGSVATFESQDGGPFGLSAPVAASLQAAVELVESVVARILQAPGPSERSEQDDVTAGGIRRHLSN